MKWIIKQKNIETYMRKVYDSMVDGMTANFPDKLKEYMKSKAF